MSLIYVLFCLGHGNVAEPFLVRFPVIDSCFLDSSQDDEEISIQLFCHQAACKVFVDDCTGAF